MMNHVILGAFPCAATELLNHLRRNNNWISHQLYNHSMAKNRRKIIRLPGYDYSLPGGYFITLVTHDRKCLFGEIHDEQIHPNTCGKIALEQWDRIPKRFPGLALSERVLMPNHFHGIILLSDEARVEKNGESINPPVLGTIIRIYKSSVTAKIRLITNSDTMVWQSNYYEHIIRNEAEMQTILDYIQTNPMRWNEDRFFH